MARLRDLPPTSPGAKSASASAHSFVDAGAGRSSFGCDLPPVGPAGEEYQPLRSIVEGEPCWHRWWPLLAPKESLPCRSSLRCVGAHLLIALPQLAS